LGSWTSRLFVIRFWSSRKSGWRRKLIFWTFRVCGTQKYHSSNLESIILVCIHRPTNIHLHIYGRNFVAVISVEDIDQLSNNLSLSTILFFRAILSLWVTRTIFWVSFFLICRQFYLIMIGNFSLQLLFEYLRSFGPKNGPKMKKYKKALWFIFSVLASCAMLDFCITKRTILMGTNSTTNQKYKQATSVLII